ncbi:MAG: transglycosylase SLT domain-containing protein [archaeon]
MRLKSFKFGMFFLIGILLISFASAYTSSFFSSSSNWNPYTHSYSSSSLLSSYNSQFYGSSLGSFTGGLWQVDSSMCTAGQDFVLQITPFGCEPAVVRSDLLAEQDVRVLCQIGATKMNPLVDVDVIDSISFGGSEIPKEISGVGYYPARAALATSLNLNSPVLNNVGFVVITLRQNRNESSLPKEVSGNLTATIKYDIRNAFGIGRTQFYLPEMSDSEWNSRYSQYGFWNSRGFLRAESVDDFFSTIAVYSDKNNKISTVGLTTGQTSEKIRIPGLDCITSLQISLDGLENPDTRARLRVNADVVEVKVNEPFLENRCYVRSIEKQGLSQKIDVRCDADDTSAPFQLVIRPSVDLEFDATKNSYEIGQKLYTADDSSSVYLGYVGTARFEKGSFRIDEERTEDLIIYLYKSRTSADKLTESEISVISARVRAMLNRANKWESILKVGENLEMIEMSKSKSVFGKDIKLAGFSGAGDFSVADSSVEKTDFNNNYESAMKTYQQITESFAGENYNDAGISYGEQAFYQKIVLAHITGQKREKIALCTEFQTAYPDSKLDKTLCALQDYKSSSLEISSKDVLINGQLRTVSFDGIYEPSLEEYGAEIVVHRGTTTTAYTLRKNQIVYLDEGAPISGELPDKLGEWKVSRTVQEVKDAIDKAGSSISSSCKNYAQEVVDAGEQYEIDPLLLVALMMTESSCNKDIISWAGAVGLMQLMPNVKEGSLNIPSYGNFIAIDGCFDNKGNLLGGKGGEWSNCSKCLNKIGNKYYSGTGPDICTKDSDDRFNPKKNIMAGAAHLKAKYETFKNGVENSCKTLKYSGWEAALLGYVGLGAGCDTFHTNYVDKVLEKYEKLGVSLSATVPATTTGVSPTMNYLQLISVERDSLGNDVASVNVNLKSTEKDGADISKTFTLQKDVAQTSGSQFSIVLAKVNLKKIARVSVIPTIENAGTTTNFSFRVGIEKRAIQLSPEQIKKKVADLEESIKEWTEKSENLGNAVKTLKTACLATGTLITLKNIITNWDGKAIARQEAMRGKGGWYEFCSGEVAKEKYDSLDKCFSMKEKEIEEEIKMREETIKQQNELLQNRQKQFETEEGIFGTKVYDTEEIVPVNAEATINALKNYGKSKKIENPLKKGEFVEVSELINKLNPEVWKKNHYYTNEQVRAIEYNLMILEKDPENKIAKRELYALAFDINKAAGDYVEKTTFQTTAKEEYGLDSDVATINLPTEKRVGTIYYTGAVVPNNMKSIQKGAYIQLLLHKGKTYYLELEKISVSQYRVKDIYDEDLNKLIDCASTDQINQPYCDPNYKEIQNANVVFSDRTLYQNEYKYSEGETKVYARYYETEPYKGTPAIVPFDLKNGWYVSVSQSLPTTDATTSYQTSGRLNSFWVCNIGTDGIENNRKGDDECIMINLATGQPLNFFHGLSESEASKLVSCAIKAVQDAQRQYKQSINKISVSTQCGGSISVLVGKPAVDIPDIQCYDLMSATECNVLFNVCDPVICPSSRCDFGGTFPVQDVVQSGIIGSVALCLPNFGNPLEGGVAIPVCLTGIKAGMDGWISVLTSYRDCLNESLTTGDMVGICDEIYSIHLCEFFWRQAIPLTKIIIPKVLEYIAGQRSRGGGEYMTVASAWQNAEKSMDYFIQYYSENSYTSFKQRLIEGITDSVCEVSISGTYPDGGNLLDSLTDPRSPPQFHGKFDEILFTTATVPPISQYKVFYHIYAGKESRAYYSVYLKGGTSSAYYQDTSTPRFVASGYIPMGGYASETKDFTAPAGYQELCIKVNNQEECGFKQVSTSFAVDYMNDLYMQEQATETVTRLEDCIAGTPSAYSLLSPNLQAGVEETVNPEIYNRGIIRICATSDPGVGTDAKAGTESARWRKIGYCDDPNIGCWLDTESVKNVIKSLEIENATLGAVSDSYLEFLRSEKEFLDDTNFDKLIKELKGEELQVQIVNVNNYYSKVAKSSQKARLLLIKADAYAGLAKESYGKLLEKIDKKETTIVKRTATGNGVYATRTTTADSSVNCKTAEKKCEKIGAGISIVEFNEGDRDIFPAGLKSPEKFTNPTTLILRGDEDCKDVKAMLSISYKKGEVEYFVRNKQIQFDSSSTYSINLLDESLFLSDLSLGNQEKLALGTYTVKIINDVSNTIPLCTVSSNDAVDYWIADFEVI